MAHVIFDSSLRIREKEEMDGGKSICAEYRNVCFDFARRILKIQSYCFKKRKLYYNSFIFVKSLSTMTIHHLKLKDLDERLEGNLTGKIPSYEKTWKF